MTLVCLPPPPAPRELDSPPADASLPVSVRAPGLAPALLTDALDEGFSFTLVVVPAAPPLAVLCASFSFTTAEVSPLPALADLGVPLFDPPLFDEEEDLAAACLALLFGVGGFDAEGFCGRGALLCLLTTACVGVVGFRGGACTAGFVCSVMPLLLLFAILASPAPRLPSTTLPVARPLCELAGFPAEETGRDLLAPAPREVGVEGLDDDATAGGRRPRRGLSESSEEELVPLLVSPRSSRFSTTRDWSIGNLRGVGGW